MRYAYVKNGVVVESNRLLPITWENISNFNLLDIDILKSYGWIPYRFQASDVPDGYKIIGRHFEIYESEVVEYEDIEKITEEEIQLRITNMWIEIRSRRNIELVESDWTQVLDSPFTPEEREEWQLYRQSLRDITLQSDPFNIVWPTKPGTQNEQ
jgi:hypothetical protein